MKVVWSAVAVFLVLCILIFLHSYIMTDMSEKILEKCDEIEKHMSDEDWSFISGKLSEIEKIWKKHKIWASATIASETIEQIEISLAQSQSYAKFNQLSGFVGEFSMFSKLIEHIPTHEGIHLEEIL